MRAPFRSGRSSQLDTARQVLAVRQACDWRCYTEAEASAFSAKEIVDELHAVAVGGIADVDRAAKGVVGLLAD